LASSVLREVALRIRIVRPAFQDLHLVAPRLSARAQIRRHAMKLRSWQHGDISVGDVDCDSIDSDLFALTVLDDYGLTDGLRIVFCEEPNPEPQGTIWVLCLMTQGEPLTSIAMEIIRGRQAIVQERTNGWSPTDFDR
jgi:hypothetical protein